MTTRRLLAAGAAAAVVLSGGGLAAAASGCHALAGPWCGERPTAPELSARGPVRLGGTTASAVFALGDRTIRQFRYADRRELSYRFVLGNDGPLPVTVVDVGTAGPAATLMRVDRLVRAGTSSTRFTVPAGAAVAVRLVLEMTDCERVSSRAGSFLSEVAIDGRVGDVLGRRSVVTLPEELHTGSPREALCPRATSSSRSPG